MIETFNFSGDAVTVLGMVGILSTALIVYTAFRNQGIYQQRRGR